MYLLQGMLSTPRSRGSGNFKARLRSAHMLFTLVGLSDYYAFPRAKSADSMKNELLMSDFCINRISLPKE